MDYSHVSFEAHWQSDEKQREDERQNSIGYAALFAFSAIQLLIAIGRTIGTNPGSFKEEKEWDFSTTD